MATSHQRMAVLIEKHEVISSLIVSYWERVGRRGANLEYYISSHTAD